MRLRVVLQRLRRVILNDLALREDQHLITADDCVESVRNRDDCRVLELLLDQVLNSLLCDDINVRSSFVKDNNSVFPQNGAADANELAFTGAQV